MKAAFQDIRRAVSGDELASKIQSEIDTANIPTGNSIGDHLGSTENIHFNSDFELNESPPIAFYTVLSKIGDKYESFGLSMTNTRVGQLLSMTREL